MRGLEAGRLHHDRALTDCIVDLTVNTTPLLELVYLMLPCYASNMAPPFVKYWRGWNRPIDRVRLGSHKTVVGFVLGVITALLIAFVQSGVSWPSTPWPPCGFRKL